MSAGTRLLSIGSIASATIGGSLLHPFVTGQVHATTTAGGSIGTGLLPASALFVAIAIALGLLAYRRHIPTVDRAISSTTFKRGTAAALALLLVSTTVAPAPVAAFDEPTGVDYWECHQDAGITGGVELAMDTIGGSDTPLEGCLQYSDFVDTSTAMSRNDAYASGLAMEDTDTAYRTSLDNLAQDKDSVMYSKAYTTALNALNDGVSEQNAMDQVNETVTEYEAMMQKTILDTVETQHYHLMYIAQRSGATNNTTTDVVRSEQYGPMYGSLADVTLTLADGTNHTIATPVIDNSGSPVAYVPAHPTTYDLSNATANWSHGTVSQIQTGAVIGVAEPSVTGYSAGDPMSASVDGDSWQLWHYEFDQDRIRIQEDMAQLVPEIYSSYQEGEISSADLAAANPTALYQEASTDRNTTGYYGFSNVMAASLGINADTNASHVVRTTLDKTSYENGSRVTSPEQVNVTGTLFYTGNDSLAFDTGTQYDPAALDGEVYMSVSSITNSSTDNQTGPQEGMVHINNTFTILEATDVTTGESLNTTQIEDKDYREVNASNLADAIQGLLDERENYDREQSAAPAGSTTGTNTMLIAAIALAAGAALMMRRDND